MELWAALSPLCCKTQEIKIHLSGQKWPGGFRCLKWPWQSPKCSQRFAGWQRSEVSLLMVLRSESWRIIWVWVAWVHLGVAVLCQSWRFLSSLHFHKQRLVFSECCHEHRAMIPAGWTEWGKFWVHSQHLHPKPLSAAFPFGNHTSGWEMSEPGSQFPVF